MLSTLVALTLIGSTVVAPASHSAQAPAWPSQTAKLKGVTLTMWCAAASLAIPKSVISSFERVTGAKIKVVTIPDPYESPVLAKIATGDKPDVAFWSPTKSGLISINAKANLLSLNGAPWISSVDPALRDVFGLLDTTRYAALIQTPNLVGMFYNKEAFAKAGITTLPKNFTQMTAAAVKLKAAGITPFYDAAKDAWPTQFMVQSLLGDAAKSGWYQKLNSREAKFTDPTFINAVTTYKALIDQGLYNSDIKSGTFAAQTTALLKGDVAMVNQGSFLGPALLAEAGDAATLDAKIGYFGISPTSNLTLSLPGQTDAIVAFKTGNAKREAATKQFLAYWMGQGYAAFLDDRSYISLQPKVPSPSTVPKLFIQVASGLKNSVGAIQSQALATPDIHVYLSNMINGTMTIEEVAQAMQTQFEQLAKAQGAKGF